MTLPPLGDPLRHVAIVTGDFVKTGGMDRANYALADYLSRNSASVELVAHRVAPELCARPSVRFVRVPKPLDSYTLGERVLDVAGRRAAARASERGGAAIVNGGNCIAPAVNWVHYVHAAYPPRLSPTLRGARAVLEGANARRRERRALARAKLAIANSRATRRVLIERLGVPAARVFVVYYGMDAERFAPASAEQASEARRSLKWPDRPCLAFVGALGDRRKGFDTLFAAFGELVRRSSWDVDLVAVGAGAELERWRQRASEAGLGERIRLLGFRKDVPAILGACDGLVAPTRYEAFGLGVAEALARGLPAVVSAAAGVAELYPQELSDLLLQDPESVSELVAALERWRANLPEQRARVAAVSARSRSRSWDAMAAEMVELMQRHVG